MGSLEHHSCQKFPFRTPTPSGRQQQRENEKERRWIVKRRKCIAFLASPRVGRTKAFSTPASSQRVERSWESLSFPWKAFSLLLDGVFRFPQRLCASLEVERQTSRRGVASSRYRDLEAVARNEWYKGCPSSMCNSSQRVDVPTPLVAKQQQSRHPPIAKPSAV